MTIYNVKSVIPNSNRATLFKLQSCNAIFTVDSMQLSNYSNTIDNVLIEYKNNQIRFEGSNFEYKINKNQEIIDFIDKIITNLMIYEQDIESPRANYV